MRSELGLNPLTAKEVDIEQVLRSDDPFDTTNHYVVPQGSKSLTKERLSGTENTSGMDDAELLWIMLPNSLQIASRFRGMGVTDERLLEICILGSIEYARDWSERDVVSSFAVYTNTRLYSQFESEIASENDMPADRVSTIMRYHNVRNLLDVNEDSSNQLMLDVIQETYFSIYPNEAGDVQVSEDLVHLYRLSDERSLGVHSTTTNAMNDQGSEFAEVMGVARTNNILSEREDGVLTSLSHGQTLEEIGFDQGVRYQAISIVKQRGIKKLRSSINIREMDQIPFTTLEIENQQAREERQRAVLYASLRLSKSREHPSYEEGVDMPFPSRQWSEKGLVGHAKLAVSGQLIPITSYPAHLYLSDGFEKEIQFRQKDVLRNKRMYRSYMGFNGTTRNSNMQVRAVMQTYGEEAMVPRDLKIVSGYVDTMDNDSEVRDDLTLFQKVRMHFASNKFWVMGEVREGSIELVFRTAETNDFVINNCEGESLEQLCSDGNLALYRGTNINNLQRVV